MTKNGITFPHELNHAFETRPVAITSRHHGSCVCDREDGTGISVACSPWVRYRGKLLKKSLSFKMKILPASLMFGLLPFR